MVRPYAYVAHSYMVRNTQITQWLVQWLVRHEIEQDNIKGFTFFGDWRNRIWSLLVFFRQPLKPLTNKETVWLSGVYKCVVKIGTLVQMIICNEYNVPCSNSLMGSIYCLSKDKKTNPYWQVAIQIAPEPHPGHCLLQEVVVCIVNFFSPWTRWISYIPSSGVGLFSCVQDPGELKKKKDR